MTYTVLQAERGPVKFASENLHPENLIAYLTIGSLEVTIFQQHLCPLASRQIRSFY